MTSTNPVSQGVAIVSGAGYGIGAAIATKLCRQGLAVALLGRSAELLSTTTMALTQNGGKAISISCDVTRWDSVQQAVSTVQDQLGAPSVLVNNAGGWLGDRIESGDADKLSGLVNVTVNGTVFMSKAVIPMMAARGGGVILNIGSTSGLPGSRDTAIASTPKAAIVQLTRTLGREVADQRIRVGILHPARVKKGVDRSIAERADESGRYKNLSPEQVADIAWYMLNQPPNVFIRELVVTPSDVEL